MLIGVETALSPHRIIPSGSTFPENTCSSNETILESVMISPILFIVNPDPGMFFCSSVPSIVQMPVHEDELYFHI